MLRTFVDINGKIQYIQPRLVTTQIEPILYNNPYDNSSLIISPVYSNDNQKITTYDIVPRPIFYTNTVTSDVNNDPELRKRVVRFFYNKFCTVWLPYSFVKLQKYLKSENGKISFIDKVSEYEKEIVNDEQKVNFIIENIFGKHEMVKFLDKFVNKFNVNWYDLKTKHLEQIKSDLYDKIKNHMRKFIISNI